MHDDEAAIILKGHLLIEYLLNRIIEKKLTTSTKLLKLNFSQKVKELESNLLKLEKELKSLSKKKR